MRIRRTRHARGCEASAADAISLKLVKHGGLLALKRVGAIAEAAGIGLYGGCLLESSVGAAAHLQAFATFSEIRWGVEHFGPQILTDDLVETPLQYEDFNILLPEGPGMGVIIDQEKVRDFREPDMLYLVEMTVNVPHGISPEVLEKLKAEEKQRAKELQESGHWKHLWRVVGRYANVSIFDVDSHDELHTLLSSLPLFPFMDIRVTALAKHPSAI